MSIFDLVTTNIDLINIIDFIEKNNININLINPSNNTRLIEYAIVQNNIKLVKYLISKKVQLSFLDNNNRSILYYPIRFNYFAIFKLLLQHIDINKEDKYNDRPIHYSIYFRNDKVFDKLKNIVDLNIIDNDKNNLLMSCALFHYTYGLNYFLKNINKNSRLDPVLYNINYKNNINETLIYLLSQNIPITSENNKIIIKLMNNKETYLNIAALPITSVEVDSTFLSNLVFTNNLEIIKQLDLTRLNINFHSNYSFTIFHYVAKVPYSIEAVSYILEHYPNYCNVNKYDRNSRIPLHYLLYHIQEGGMTEIYYNYLKLLVPLSKLYILDLKKNTCLSLMILMGIWKEFKHIFETKKLLLTYNKNFSVVDLISDPQDKEEFLTICYKSYLRYMGNVKLSKKQFIEGVLSKQITTTYTYIKLDIEKYSNVDILNTNQTGYNELIDSIIGLKFLQHNGINALLDLNPDNSYCNFIKNYNFYYMKKKQYCYYQKYIISWLRKQLYWHNDIFDLLKNASQPLSVILVDVFGSYDNVSHANILIYTKKTNSIFLYDPIGSLSIAFGKFNVPQLEEKLYNLFKEHDITFIKTDFYKEQIGLQTLATSYVGEDLHDCSTWCILFAYLKNKNLTLSNSKLNKLIKQHILDNNYGFIYEFFQVNINKYKQRILTKLHISHTNAADDVFDPEDLKRIMYEVDRINFD